MSTAPSRRKSASIDRRFAAWLTAFVVLLGFGGAASALTSDRGQVVNVNADHSVMSQESGKAVLTGHVRIDQGSLHADGNQGTGYFDQSNTLQRVVLAGSPAHFQQKRDDGSLVHGQAETIDYLVSENTVILAGNATVVQQGRGEFHGAKLTYNTDSGEIVGESAAGGQVHMTFQPKQKPAKPKSAPAGARSSAAIPAAPASPSTPAPARSAATPGVSTSAAAPAPAVSTGLVPASTAGTH